jgi:dienelactone hydrolase
MDGDLRGRLSALLRFAVPPAPELVVHGERRREGYVERAVSFEGDGGAPVPAFLLEPDEPSGGAVVAHHQHHSQWHLGKSEVAGPGLARRGVTVLTADAIGFEDRRPGGPGTDRRPSDASDYFDTMCYRLVRGRPLMCSVLADAAAAHSVLASLEGIDSRRVGAAGHSMGGAIALLHAALDERIAFAAVSGSACTYRERMERGVGIDCAQAVPGVLEVADVDGIAPLVAPRPLLVCSADGDEYSRDAPAIVAVAERAYGARGAPDAIRHIRAHGGHALTRERFETIVDWVVAQL